MGNKNFEGPKETDVINASEIGQFHFCSNSWYLQKCGYEPISQKLNVGIEKHKEYGKILDNTQRNLKRYRIFAIAGYLILILTFLLILIEVIL